MNQTPVQITLIQCPCCASGRKGAISSLIFIFCLAGGIFSAIHFEIQNVILRLFGPDEKAEATLLPSQSPTNTTFLPFTSTQPPNAKSESLALQPPKQSSLRPTRQLSPLPMNRPTFSLPSMETAVDSIEDSSPLQTTQVDAKNNSPTLSFTLSPTILAISSTQVPTLSPTVSYSSLEHVLLHAYGEADGDQYGASVSLSRNGKRLAVGSRSYVHVYDYSAEGDFLLPVVLHSAQARIMPTTAKSMSSFGNYFLVSSSGDGNILAVAHKSDRYYISTYIHASNKWTRFGPDIIVPGYAKYPCSISLAGNGERVAVGVPGDRDEIGQVYVYRFNYYLSEDYDGYWTLMGKPIIGQFTKGLFFGWSVSLSTNGEIVAVGAPKASVTNKGFGYVSVYKFKADPYAEEETTEKWSKLGSDDITSAEEVNELFGYSVSISSDGAYVAVGSPDYDGSGSRMGRTSVYALRPHPYDDSIISWEQYGAVALNGKKDNDRSGYSVSISHDGNRLLVGSPGYDSSGGGDGGYASVYQFEASNGIWVRVKSYDATEGFFGDGAGHSVSLSENNIIAVGAPMLENQERGYVLAYHTAKNTEGVDGAGAEDETTACGLCPEGVELTRPNAFIDKGTVKTCSMIDTELSSLRDSKMCMTAQLFASNSKARCCGDEYMTLDRCTLCQDGSEVENPNIYVEELNATCGELILQADAHPYDQCFSIQHFSPLCGCEYETKLVQCYFCQTGLDNPNLIVEKLGDTCYNIAIELPNSVMDQYECYKTQSILTVAGCSCMLQL